MKIQLPYLADVLSESDFVVLLGKDEQSYDIFGDFWHLLIANSFIKIKKTFYKNVQWKNNGVAGMNVLTFVNNRHSNSVEM